VGIGVVQLVGLLAVIGGVIWLVVYLRGKNKRPGPYPPGYGPTQQYPQQPGYPPAYPQQPGYPPASPQQPGSPPA
jgi:hypothetical protein